MSLTELLTVVAIILVLVAILIVGMDHFYSQAMQTQCQHRLEQIGHAIEMYSSNHDSLLPRSWDTYTGRLWYQTLAGTYLDSWDVLGCPVAGLPPQKESGGGSLVDPSREHIDVLLAALRWLSERQTKDGAYAGRWSAASSHYHAGVTSLALMAFLGFGCTDKYPPEFAQTVRLAVDYLSSSRGQYKTGANAGQFIHNTAKPVYSHGTCTMALCGASRTMVDSALRQQARGAAQLALDHLAAVLPPEGACGYNGAMEIRDYGGPEPGGDTSCTGWVYQGFAAGRVAGLGLPQSVWDRAERYLDECCSSSGRSTYFYTPPITGSANWLWEKHTPISLTSRLMTGHSPDAADSLLSANTLMENNHVITYHSTRKDFYSKYYTTLAFFRMGGTYWSAWHDFYPAKILEYMQQQGADKAWWPQDCCGTSSQAGGGNSGGDVYSTAIACLILEAPFEEHWINPSWTPATGRCSYGYNNRLGQSRRRPAADTIVVMDYEHWEIDHDEVDVEKNDGPEKIAARHAGKANCLLGDGHVRALDPQEITDAMWTLEQDH